MLGEDQFKNFNRDGVVHLRGVLTSQEIDLLRSGVDAQFAQCGRSSTGYDFEAFARQVWEEKFAVDVGAANRFEMESVKARIQNGDTEDLVREHAPQSDNAAFFYDSAGWRHYPSIRTVAFDSRLPEIAAALMHSEYVTFWEDTTFVKTPGCRQKTVYHQDYAFAQIEGSKCVIAWIPLDSVSLKNGALKYVRGSHKWGRTFAPNLIISNLPALNTSDGQVPDIASHEGDYDIISFDAEPGDVLMHHVMTIHGAGGNLSDANRRAISFRYCGDDIRYLDRPGSIPQHGIKNKLNDGDPLWSHDYPVVWPKPWPGFKLAKHWSLPLNGNACI